MLLHASCGQGKLHTMTQDNAFTVLSMGKNVFLTGPAGSGKTHVLRNYIAWLRDRDIETAVTASTGIAASHLGGVTIHSWSGIGARDNLSAYDIDRIEQTEHLVKRFRATKVLIIDEISMLSAKTLEMVDTSIRAGTQRNEPFGGLRVVLCGDFFQLPPVVRGSGDADFAFSSPLWQDLQPHVCYLTEQHRQGDDPLLNILTGIRDGEVKDTMVTSLNSRVGLEPEGDVPYLYTHNIDVDRVNNERLTALSGSMYRFDMSTSGSKKNIALLTKGLLVPEVLQLKVGATVMFVKNHPQGHYVNGTTGVVEEVVRHVPMVRTRDGKLIHVEPASWTLEDNGKVRAEVTQIPLRLAWAITVHKSQGMTLDAARIDLRKTFVSGQGYVALSRIRSLDGLYLDGFTAMAYARHPMVAEWDQRFRNTSAHVERRVACTDAQRLRALSDAFVAEVGGHPPVPGGAKRKNAKNEKRSTYEKTRDMVLEECPISDIAQRRGVTEGTVIGHIEHLLTEGILAEDDIAYMKVDVDETTLKEVGTAFKEANGWSLAAARSQSGHEYTYDTLRFLRLFVRDWREDASDAKQGATKKK
jgi:ATP-dependent DNA helicase PIF1